MTMKRDLETSSIRSDKKRENEKTCVVILEKEILMSFKNKIFYLKTNLTLTRKKMSLANPRKKNKLIELTAKIQIDGGSNLARSVARNNAIQSGVGFYDIVERQRDIEGVFLAAGHNLEERALVLVELILAAPPLDRRLWASGERALKN
jgi:hypothetical protein